MSRQPTPPQLLLENQLCFLFHRISRDLDAAYRPLLNELGLTYPQYLVMLVLWEQDGRSVGEIGQELCLDSGTLSPQDRRRSRRIPTTARPTHTDRRATGGLAGVAGVTDWTDSRDRHICARSSSPARVQMSTSKAMDSRSPASADGRAAR